MNAENVFGLMIYLAVAIIMMGIGIYQLKSKKPVGFYNGEKQPTEDEISDVKAWNKRHGLMWLIYGAVIMVTYGIGAIMGDTIWCVIPMCGGIIIPLPVMIWYHHKLIKIYRNNYVKRSE